MAVELRYRSGKSVATAVCTRGSAGARLSPPQNRPPYWHGKGLMSKKEFARKARVALGVEAGRSATEIAMAVAFLLLLGIVSWSVVQFASGIARTGLMSFLIS